MQNVSVLVVVLLAACNLKSSMTSGSSGTTPSSSQTSSSSGGSSGGGGGGKAAFPDLNGKTPEEAEATLRAAGFTGRVVVDRTSAACVEDATPPQGKIDCHSPEPGEVVYVDKEVQVHVYESRQRAGVLMAAQLAPIKGMKIEEAKAYLKKIGHTGKVDVTTGMVVSDKCVPGTVCSFNAQGASEPIDVDIDLYTKE